MSPPASHFPAESLSVKSSPGGEVTLQVGSPLILTCEVQGLPSEVSSGLLVQWMRRGSLSSDGVEVHEYKNTVGSHLIFVLQDRLDNDFMLCISTVDPLRGE